jgi:hypothetical protein
MQTPQGGKGIARLGGAGEKIISRKGSDRATPSLPHTLLIYPRSILIVCQHALMKSYGLIFIMSAKMGTNPPYQQATPTH